MHRNTLFTWQEAKEINDRNNNSDVKQPYLPYTDGYRSLLGDGYKTVAETQRVEPIEALGFKKK